MSLTPTDESEVQDSDGLFGQADHSEYSLTGRARLRSIVAAVQRDVAGRQRSLRRAVRTGLDRLLSPGLAATEQHSLADDAVQPPRCPPIESLPARAFPLTYPTRAYRLVENDPDLTTEKHADTVTISHPESSEAWVESDTWTDLQR